MAKKITTHVDWVGTIDWDLRTFHGEEYSTHRGSSYNSFLIRDEKTVLIDTVWAPHGDDFVAELKKVIDLKDIDYIVANHSEVDHSGALPKLMEEIPGTPIYCTKNGAKILKGHYHEDWYFVTVNTGDTLDLGKGKLIFVEAPMLHWPDSMFEYYTADQVLFSNDAFGQHYASIHLFNDKVDQAELEQEAIKYYANILTPFSKLVTRKIEEVLSLDLPVQMILPSHGVLWRDEPAQILEKYLAWADDYQENQVTILYDTMWGATKKMADAISQGLHEERPDLTIKAYHVGKTDKNDVITEVFKSKMILVGSSTINKGILSGMSGLLEMIEGLSFRGKKAAAFGSYGWSGEHLELLNKRIDQTSLERVHEGIKHPWMPDEEAKMALRAYGRELAQKL